MYNRRYDKVFVMLRQEMNGFAAGQRPAWGSCTMEIKNGKGRLAATVQGLKKLKEDRNYVFYVVAGKTGQAEGIVCCPLEIDDYGKGEIRWEFDPDNIAGTGYIAEELHTATLLVKGKDDYGLIAPLAGYFDEKINWKSRYQEKSIPEVKLQGETESPLEVVKESPVAEVMENVEVAVQEPKKEEEKVAVQEKQLKEEVQLPSVEETSPAEDVGIASCEALASAIPGNQQKSNFQQSFSDMLKNFQRELIELEKQGIIKPEDRKRIDLSGQLAGSKESEEKQLESNPALEYILLHNTEIIPFDEDNKKWKCISMEELVVLPVDSLSMMRNTFFQLAYRRYKHFILSSEDGGVYYLGIPDTYSSENKRVTEDFDFQGFKACGQEPMQENAYGYWMKRISE